MIALDERALICDFASEYHVFDRRALPPKLQATLAVGLPENSRIMRKINGASQPLDIMILAAVVDRLSLLVWMQTDDARKGRNQPKSILAEITNRDSGKPVEGDVILYSSGEDFMKARAALIEKIESEG